MSGKLLAIVRREYIERVRTRSFVIATVLGPVLMTAMMIVPMIMATRSGKPLHVAVVDATGSLQVAAEAALRAARFDDKARFDVVPSEGGPAEARQAALKKEVLAGRLDGYVVLPAGALESATASYFGRSVSNRIDLRTMERSLSDLLIGERLENAGLDSARIKKLTKELDLKTIQLSEKGEREDRGAAVLFAIILMMILYMSIQMWGQSPDDRSDRGEGQPCHRGAGVGRAVDPAPLRQAARDRGRGLHAARRLDGFPRSALAGTCRDELELLSMPDLSPFVLVSFMLFFLLGFLLYAALYAAIGAAVNTVQEAQNFVFPVLLPLIGGLVCFPVVLESPESGLSVGLSLVPLISPLIMFLRILVLTPPLWQIALSLVLLVATIVAVLWLSARIYRVGILMYGKKPTFPELMRWVRHS